MRTYSWAAIVVLFVGVMVEGFRLLSNTPWPGFNAMNSHIVSGLLVTIFATTAWAMARGTRAAVLERVLATAATLAMAGHGLTTLVAGQHLGFLYIPSAVVFVLLANRAFRAEGRKEARIPTHEVVGGRVR